MQIEIEKTDLNREFYTDERCHIVEIHNHPNDRSHSIARARIEKGVTTAWHRVMDTTESYYILEGEGQMEIGKTFNQKVIKGDSITIPSGAAQRIKNIGSQDLVILCVCAPAFDVANYRSVE